MNAKLVWQENPDRKTFPRLEKYIVPLRKKEESILDVSNVTKENGKPHVAKPHWHMMVEERTGIKFSFFKEIVDA